MAEEGEEGRGWEVTGCTLPNYREQPRMAAFNPLCMSTYEQLNVTYVL